ncbi:MAG: hypothetical protein HEQ27_07210 [Dolichospermum sp. JUN01]|nr:hypothetical protein [Dolichospermum sp. JUN01]
MEQQEKTLRASSDGIEKIKAAMKKEGYTQNSAKTPIYKVTKQELERYIKKNIINSNTTQLDNPNLTVLLDQHLHIFSGYSNISQSSRDIVRTYIEQVKAPIQLDNFLRDLEGKQVTAFQLTDANWRTFCTGKDARKSKQKGQEKLLPESVFNAFCEILRLNPDEIAYKPDNTIELEDKLKLFNHERQINLLIEKVQDGKNTFLISNDCLYSRSWMLHRLEKAIESCFLQTKTKINKYSIITLNSSSENIHTQLSTSITNFKSIFHKNDIYNKLKQQHIILVINIDHYCYDIENINKIYDFHQTMYQAKSPDNDGQLLMFLLAKDCNLQNRSSINNNIIELQKADYNSSHLTQLLNMEKSMADSIIDHCQNNAKNLLIKLYEHLKINRDPATLKIWSNYPWN